MTCGLGTRPIVPPSLALARGLRIVVIATALAVLALFADAQLRSHEPAVLLPVPREFRAPAPHVTAPADGSEKPALEAAVPGAPSAAERADEAAGLEPSAPPPPSAPASATVRSPTRMEPPEAGARPSAPAPRPTVRDGVLAYQAGDYARAYAIWRQLAEAGNARARFHLGALYLEGRLGPPDYVSAYRWLALAAEAGQSAAVPLRDQAAKALTPDELATIRRALGLAPDP